MAERLCSKCVHNNCCFISQGYGAGTIHTDLDAMDCDDYHEKQEWISVEERLPDAGYTVVIIFTIGNYQYARVGWRRYSGEWFQAGLGVVEGKVTHWMPLPEPPEEDAKQ